MDPAAADGLDAGWFVAQPVRVGALYIVRHAANILEEGDDRRVTAAGKLQKLISDTTQFQRLVGPWIMKTLAILVE